MSADLTVPPLPVAAWQWPSGLLNYSPLDPISEPHLAPKCIPLVRKADAEAALASLQARLEAAELDVKRLNDIADNYWKLDPFAMFDDDVGWRVVEYHQGKPHERTVAEVCMDDPRAAIDAATQEKPAAPSEGSQG